MKEVVHILYETINMKNENSQNHRHRKQVKGWQGPKEGEDEE